MQRVVEVEPGGQWGRETCLSVALSNLTHVHPGVRVDGSLRWFHPQREVQQERSAFAAGIAERVASGEVTASLLLEKATQRLHEMHPSGDARSFLVGATKAPAGRILDLATRRRLVSFVGPGGRRLDCVIELDRTGDALQPGKRRWALSPRLVQPAESGDRFVAHAVLQRGVPDDGDILGAMEGLDLEGFGVTPESLLHSMRKELEVIRVVPDGFEDAWRAMHRRWALEGPEPWSPVHALVEEVLEPVMEWLGEWHRWRSGVFDVQEALATREALASLSLLPAQVAKECRRDAGLIAWWRTSLGITEDPRIAQVDLPVYTAHVSSGLRDVILSALEGSRGTGTTGVLIHGGALSALDLLRNHKHPPVDVVYIDPPYNTGNRGFRYNDAFPREVWTDWLRRCFKSTRSLCSPRASVWASIDDHAVHDLRGVMDEAFGSDNHLGTVAWRKKVVRGRGAKHLIPQVEYIHAHAIDVTQVEPFEEPLTEAMLAEYRLSDDRGPYKRIPLAKSGTAQSPRPNLVYPIEAPDGSLIACPTHQWRWSRETLARRMDEIEFIRGKDERWRVFTRQRPTVDGRPRGRTPSTLQDRHTTTDGTRELKDVLGELAVGFPKPMGLIRDILTWTSSNGRNPPRWVLDFFGGTGTSVDAVLHWRTEHPEADVRVICVEAGPWFEDALVCRVARRASSQTWKGGQPIGGPATVVHFDVWTLPDVEASFEALSISS